MVALSKKDMAQRLNVALKQEHACHIRYSTHASTIVGPYSKAVEERLKEIASDEARHAQMLRDRIVALGEKPTLEVAEGDLRPARTLKEIIDVNLEEEAKAIAMYKSIWAEIPETEVSLFETIEDILEDEQEHTEELERLKG